MRTTSFNNGFWNESFEPPNEWDHMALGKIRISLILYKVFLLILYIILSFWINTAPLAI